MASVLLSGRRLWKTSQRAWNGKVQRPRPREEVVRGPSHRALILLKGLDSSQHPKSRSVIDTYRKSICSKYLLQRC